MCSCREGFTGNLCEVQISPCTSEPCGRFGTCLEGTDDNFECLCSPGFSGLMCEIDIDECRSGPCQNGGICSDGPGSFSCLCSPEYSGALCEEQIIFCSSDACSNGGMCLESQNGFSCSCPIGFEGSLCQIDTDECLISPPCLNNGTCINLPGSYACVCSPGFTGENCTTIINFCTNTSCSDNGVCQSLVDGFECLCDSGFTGARCDIEINECISSPCLNNAVCVDGLDHFMCVCEPGFTGVVCEINIDECHLSSCAEGSTCMDGIHSFTCLCSPGFTGELCDIQTDFCLDDPCYNGNCNSIANGFTCDCFTGWTGDRCQFATSVAMKLDSCGLPSAADILSVENLATSNQPISFDSNAEVVSARYAISSSTDGIFWSSWVWQEEGTQATLFSLTDPLNMLAIEVVSNLPAREISFYYTTTDNLNAPITVTFNNVPTRGNQWYHVSIAVFNSNKIIVALGTDFVQEQILPNTEAVLSFEIPISFNLTVGQKSSLIGVDSSTFAGIMRGVTVAGVTDERMFNISYIVSCVVNCVGDNGFCGTYGQCMDQFGSDRQCTCSYGYTGLQCRELESRFSFNGNGFAQFQDSELISDHRFEFKTDATEGQIVSRTLQTLELSIELRNVTLELSLDYCDSSQQVHRLMDTSSPLNDLQWHAVSIRDTVLLDNNPVENLPDRLQPSCNLTQQGRIVLGQSYQGCLRDFELDGQLINPTTVQLEGGAQFGCTRDTAQFFSVSHVQLPEFISREFQTIAFDLSTLSPNGTVYFSSNRVPSDATGNRTTDFVIVYIESGRVVFSFNLGEQGQDLILQSPLPVNDGRWHHVEVIQNMAMGSLSVDGNITEDTLDGPLRFLDTTGGVFLGGVPPASRPFPLTTSGFNGCIRDLEQNGVAVDLQDNIDNQNVQFGTCN